MKGKITGKNGNSDRAWLSLSIASEKIRIHRSYLTTLFPNKQVRGPT
jgi:hypothetical protein